MCVYVCVCVCIEEVECAESSKGREEVVEGEQGRRERNVRQRRR